MGQISYNPENKSQKIKLYTLYWLGYILLFSMIQGLPEDDFIMAWRNEWYSVLPKILFVTIIVEFLMPNLLFKKKTAIFIGCYVLLILVFAFLQRLIDNYIILRYYMTFWKREPLLSAPVFLYNVSKLQFVVTTPIAFKLLYYLAEEKNKVQTILSEKLQAELSSLRNQFHPHFLFNVLNSLYSKILNKSDDSAEIVIKISDLLRFSIYDLNNKSISLQNEIDYLKNYISLQQLRFENQLQLSFSLYGNVENHFIEPFLILPFIENSYKHCLDENNQGWITIAINASDEWLVVKIENSLPKHYNTIGDNVRSGIGIANVKRRLELLYPAKHTLTIKNEMLSFFVSLKIKIKDVSN
ncbi:putative regulator of cell autolysis [Flavobacterium anhuiense]|uniref:Putative regulator of cell autolysis n=1 Tax=Flavobacterium anhuiense TaxID=459526 RepID=A0A444VZG7_9FLAO|nr:histidine kinase [Flavobacterium anhuiense]RYJ38872.1 putative regulator of cell autolysis [Flavobacterium anhuiense]